MVTAPPPPRRRLIVNADDFGLGFGINAGIAQAVAEGIVTSVSLMANGAAIAEAVAMARKWPQISTGAHLALVGGEPVSPPASLPSLVDREGRFPPSYRAFLRRWLRGGIRPEEVYREWSTQVALLRRQGLELTHLDSHQHLHVLPVMLPVAVRVAREHGIEAMRLPLELKSTSPRPKAPPLETTSILGQRSGGPNPDEPIRQRRRRFESLLLQAAARLARPRVQRAGLWSPDYFIGFTDSGRMTIPILAQHLEHLPEGVTELMTHPGFPDTAASTLFPRPYLWEEEVAALTDPRIQHRLEELGIELVSYRPF